MRIIGLTGGIGTGKSSVSRILQNEYGIPIIDADCLARRVVEPGTAGLQEILAYFGPSTPGLVDANGNLDRAVLGRRVFGNEVDRKKLNSIIHPRVRWAIFYAVISYYIRGYDLVILDVPLLFESKLDRFCSSTVVVACEKSTQRRRLLERDAHLSEQDADARIAAQMPLQEKCQRANCVIWNEGSMQELQEKSVRVFRSLRPSRLEHTITWFGPPTLVAAICTGVLLRSLYRH